MRDKHGKLIRTPFGQKTFSLQNLMWPKSACHLKHLGSFHQPHGGMLLMLRGPSIICWATGARTHGCAVRSEVYSYQYRCLFAICQQCKRRSLIPVCWEALHKADQLSHVGDLPSNGAASKPRNGPGLILCTILAGHPFDLVFP